MQLDKNDNVVLKLVAAACATPVLTKEMTVEQCAINVVARPTNNEHSHELKEIIATVKRWTPYSTSEIELALRDMEEIGILSSWQPSGSLVIERPKFYRLSPEFAQLMAGSVKRTPTPLVEINIKVKGNEVLLKDLYFFYKNINWLMKTQPDLEYIWVGPSKLTRDEAAGLKAHLVAYHPFGED